MRLILMYNLLHHASDDEVFCQVDRFIRGLAKGKLADAVFSSGRVKTDDYKEFSYRIIYVLGSDTYLIEARGPAVSLVSWDQITSPTN